MPAVCLEKVIQNHETPITLKNSLLFKNKVQTIKRPKYENVLSTQKEEEEEETETLMTNKNNDNETNKPTLVDSSASEIYHSIEKYSDKTGETMSFEKGQRFKVIPKIEE